MIAELPGGGTIKDMRTLTDGHLSGGGAKADFEEGYEEGE